METLFRHTVRRTQQAQIDDLRRQNVEMLAVVTQLVAEKHEHPPTHPAQNAGEVAVQIPGDHNQVAVDNSKKITINVFGQEGVGHSTTGRIKAILDESLKIAALPEAARSAVMQTAQLIFSDPAHPENLTCFLIPSRNNKKTDDALVHGASGWEVQPVSQVLPPMAKRSVDMLFDQQPYEDAEVYGGLMKELAATEAKNAGSADLRPLLVRNKAALLAALGVAPRAGGVLQLAEPAE